MTGLLSAIVMKLGRPEDSYEDEDGVFAMRYEDKIVVAKTYILGDTVSCHSLLLPVARRYAVPIVMFIEEQKKFYSFDPKEIKEDSRTWYNFRGHQEMVNFNIRLGDRAMKQEVEEQGLKRFLK